MIDNFLQASVYALGIGTVVAILLAIRYLVKIERSQKNAITKLTKLESIILEMEKKILNKLSSKKRKK